MMNKIVEHPSPNSCSIAEELCPRDEHGEIVQIDGLSYHRNFFTEEEQETLLNIIYSNPWQKVIARRQQFYGECYYHTSHKDPKLQPNIDKTDDISLREPKEEEKKEDSHDSSLTINELKARLERCVPFFGEKGFPTQILINEYRNTLGIASHFEDFDAFGDIILTISLVNPLYMTLKKPFVRTNACEDYHDIRKILLEPGSLLVMQGDARNDYRHGISKYKWIRNLPDNQPDILRDDSYRRVSITLRHLKATRRQVSSEDDESSDWKYSEGHHRFNGSKSLIQNLQFCNRPHKMENDRSWMFR